MKKTIRKYKFFLYFTFMSILGLAFKKLLLNEAANKIFSFKYNS